MDDGSMNHILEATGFSGTGVHELDGGAASPRLRRRIPWERAIRCLLLTALIALVGYLAWRPALLRFSQLMFMVSPSHGDSLAWKPDVEDAPLRLAPRRETPEPSEWRLATGMYGGWRAERSSPNARPLWRGPSQLPAHWQRLSTNPWSWQDDAIPAKPARAPTESPAQKPATGFRAKATDAWGVAVSAAPVQRIQETTTAREQETDSIDAAGTTEAATTPTDYPARQIPVLDPLPTVATPARPAEPEGAAIDSAKVTEELPPLRIPDLAARDDRPGLSELPPLAVDAFANERKSQDAVEVVSEGATATQPDTMIPVAEPAGALRPSLSPTPSTSPAPTLSVPAFVEPSSPEPSPTKSSPWRQIEQAQPAQPEVVAESAAEQTDWTQFVVPTPQPEAKAAGTDLLEQASHGEILVSTPVFQTPSVDTSSGTQTASPLNAPESADWKNQEITGPISGAYLTIYPKLKFIGLCVPGQGYIRKYNQVAVPRETTGEKIVAADGRTPYGKYYIAARSRTADGPRLVLSWPSPDDARRLGLDAMQTALIENAWLGQTLPPQDTPAGGGIALTGLRERLESTDGGFALEAPHMEEIFTALPHGAWVFIQE